MANKTYTFSASNTNGSVVALYIVDHATRTTLASSSLVATYTPTQNVIVYFQAYRGSGIPSEAEFQLEIGSQTEYEPYTSSTLSLPISTYFPNGMKSAGSVYDELTESKAITRVGSVDLGTLTWNHLTSGGSNGYWLVGTGSIPNAKYISNYSGINIKGINPVDGSMIQSVGAYQMDGGTVSKIGIAQNGSAYYQNASATVAPTGILYYELAIETEVDVNLDLSYKTYEGGTEQLLPENGSVPVTSPMKTNVEFDFDENINALLGKMLNMIAPVETSPTSNEYTVGQYLIYDYVLYKVTSAIASGGTITVGTNVEATTIASVLESL